MHAKLLRPGILNLCAPPKTVETIACTLSITCLRDLMQTILHNVPLQLARQILKGLMCLHELLIKPLTPVLGSIQARHPILDALLPAIPDAPHWRQQSLSPLSRAGQAMWAGACAPQRHPGQPEPGGCHWRRRRSRGQGWPGEAPAAWAAEGAHMTGEQIAGRPAEGAVAARITRHTSAAYAQRICRLYVYHRRRFDNSLSQRCCSCTQ